MTRPRKQKQNKSAAETGTATPPDALQDAPAEAAAAEAEAQGDGSGEDVWEPAGESAFGEEAAPEVPSLEETLRRERDDFQEKWLRVVAELDNVRKRARREVADTRRLAQAEVLRPLLEIRDNFERALRSLQANQDNEGAGRVLEGVDLIFQNFKGVLTERGVQPIAALDQPFDPAFHEALGQLPREGVESGQVIEIVQQGFVFEDLVLRPARVIISS